MRFLILLLLIPLTACRTEPQKFEKKDPVEVPTTNATIMSDCEAGAAGSCLMLGVRYERGENVNRDIDKAFEFYEQSCKLGSSHGCYAKALVLFHERDNPIQALSFLEHGCDQQKHGPSCVVLGDIARDGEVYAVDEREALHRYGQACETGYHIGCNAYIRHLWTASQQLVGLQDFVRFLEQNCDAGHEMSCNEVAELHQTGAQWGAEALPPSRAKADQYHAKLATAKRTRIVVDATGTPPPLEMPVRDVTQRSDPTPFEPGYLVITGLDGAAIVVDGVDTGKKSPATVTIFTGGKHSVQLLAGQSLSKAKQTWIDSGDRVELHFE